MRSGICGMMIGREQRGGEEIDGEGRGQRGVGEEVGERLGGGEEGGEVRPREGGEGGGQQEEEAAGAQPGDDGGEQHGGGVDVRRDHRLVRRFGGGDAGGEPAHRHGVQAQGLAAPQAPPQGAQLPLAAIIQLRF